MDEKLKEMKGKLEDLDNEFKNLEETVEVQTNKYLEIINNLSNCGNQNKIIDIRIRNQQALKESICKNFN
jgi:archaellum component FlaC